MNIDYKMISEILTFDSDIDTESVSALIDKCQVILRTNPEQKMLIYFSTCGGSFAHSELLLEYLNSNKDNIILCGFHQISSAGFYIFFKFEGQKDIVNHTFAILHHGDRKTSYRDLSNQETFDFFMVESVSKHMKVAMLALCAKLGISRKLMKVMEQGKDIFFDVEALKKFLAKK